MVRKLAWSGITAAFGAAAAVAAQRAAATMWRLATGEEPPERR